MGVPPAEPLEFVAAYLLQGDQPLLEMLE